MKQQSNRTAAAETFLIRRSPLLLEEAVSLQLASASKHSKPSFGGRDPDGISRYPSDPQTAFANRGNIKRPLVFLIRYYVSDIILL
jgi:hypothetical protein